jgi:hypothetical protein
MRAARVVSVGYRLSVKRMVGVGAGTVPKSRFLILVLEGLSHNVGIISKFSLITLRLWFGYGGKNG